MRGANLWHKLREAGLARAPTVLADSIKRALAPRLDKRIIVYALDAAAYAAGPPVPWPEGLEVVRVDPDEPLPEALLASSDDPALPAIRAGMAAERARGACVYLGHYGGSLAAVQCSITARQLEKWHRAIAPDDLLIYAASTLNLWRGRGIHPAMIRHIMEQPDNATRAIHADTQIWNTVAQRNIEKAGYRRVAVHKDGKPRIALH